MSYIPEPITRIDKYLAYIAGNMDVALPDHPITRKEHYLAAWAEKSGFEDVDVAGDPPLTLKNGIGKPLKGLRIYGKSKQVTTTGAQLLDPNKATVDGWNIKYDIPLEKSKTYTFTNGEKAANSVAIFGVNPDEADENLSVKYLSPKESYTFTCAKDYASIILGGSDEKTVFDGRYMLNAGSTPLPWEPYTGGKSSPSPDYPQEIESAGMRWSTGKNLLDTDNINTSTNSTWAIHQNGYSITAQGTYAKNDPNAYKNVRIALDPAIVAGKKITASVEYAENNAGELPRGICDINYIKQSGEKTYYNNFGVNNPITITIPEDIVSINCRIHVIENREETVEYGTYTTTVKGLMISISDKVLPWEPYTGGVPKPYGDKIGVTVGNGVDESQSMSISTPNGLPGIPVASGGNYTDPDGQQWICDEIDFARGMYVQNIKVDKNLNDLEWMTWGVNKRGDGITGFYTYNIDTPKIQETVSNIAIYNNDIYGGKRTGICASIIKPTSQTPYMILSVRNDTISDTSSNAAAIQSFKEMLAETDAYMMYVLAAPIETPLTSDQLNAYKALRTYKGTTIIDNDAGAYMSVKYEKMK